MHKEYQPLNIYFIQQNAHKKKKLLQQMTTTVSHAHTRIYFQLFSGKVILEVSLFAQRTYYVRNPSIYCYIISQKDEAKLEIDFNV